MAKKNDLKNSMSAGLTGGLDSLIQSTAGQKEAQKPKKAKTVHCFKLVLVVGVALVSAALLNTLKPIAFREEVSTFAISSSEQLISSTPKIAQSITVLFFIK